MLFKISSDFLCLVKNEIGMLHSLLFYWLSISIRYRQSYQSLSLFPQSVADMSHWNDFLLSLLNAIETIYLVALDWFRDLNEHSSSEQHTTGLLYVNYFSKGMTLRQKHKTFTDHIQLYGMIYLNLPGSQVLSTFQMQNCYKFVGLKQDCNICRYGCKNHNHLSNENINLSSLVW